jgi:E3 ubiquitin-protein ligase MYCBP2
LLWQIEVKDPPQGVVPPPNEDTKKTTCNDSVHRLRKFIAKPSAGLRIRIHPTLQSEQIGVIPVDGTVSIMDEISNSDGVWVRLGPETMAEAAPSHHEGWCLQFNQHLEKTLMVPVTEPKSAKGLRKSADSGVVGSGSPGVGRALRVFPGQPMVLPAAQDKARFVARGPGQYTVVKCGASGHNIRSNPNLSAAPIGMLNLGDCVTIINVKEENGEVWVQLDQESIDQHCFSFDGDAWSLAVSATDVQYLESEAEIEEDKFLLAQMMSSSAGPVPSAAARRFRPSQEVEQLEASEVPKPRPRTEGFPVGGGIPRRKSDVGGGRKHSPVQFAFRASQDGKPTPPPRLSLNRDSSHSPSRKAGGPSPPNSADARGKPSFFSKFFKGEAGRRGASASPPTARKPLLPPPPASVGGAAAAAAPPIHVNKDIPPELQGVSVKELVKVIGESRANGNGVTPPGTPKSQRRASRPCSPQVSRSQSSSPASVRSGQTAVSSQPIAVAASKTSLSQSPLSAEASMLNRQDSSQSDTSALVSSIARDLSQSPGSATHEMSASPTFSTKSRQASQSPSTSRRRSNRSDPELDQADRIEPVLSEKESQQLLQQGNSSPLKRRTTSKPSNHDAKQPKAR